VKLKIFSKRKVQTEENDQGDINSEIQDYLEVRQQRRWIFPRAALVGACAGGVSLLFRFALSLMDTWRTNLITWARQFPYFGWIFPVIFVLAGTLLSVAITRKFAPEAAGSGIPHLEAVLQRFRKLDWKRVLPVKFIGGVISIGGGLALGREGPTVQMGGAIGDAIGRLLKTSEKERLTLISSGAGAGLAAAFNAPLSGLIFVLEEVRRDFQPIIFGAAFIAAVVADVVARFGAGQLSVFSIPSYDMPSLNTLPVFVVLGVVTGLLGVLFNKALMKSVTLMGKLKPKTLIIINALIGGTIGLVGWFSPQLLGSGHNLAEEALKGNLVLAIIPIFFIVRFLMTTFSYSTGAPGGIFAPLLVLGSLIGLGIGQLTQHFFPAFAPIPAVFAVVGMAAYFAAIVRAPLTGIMLIIEMTGSYSLMLPLLVSCFCAYIVAEALKDLPIYEALLERDLKISGVVTQMKSPMIREFSIQPGSAFSGQQIRYLGLPAGCIIIRCMDGKREWVPKANTRLEPHMRITTVISPEAAESVEMLRNGCKAQK
jgi:CIC family chloride channel protein